MAKSRFEPCLEILFPMEGGYSNRSVADDPGGPTNLGITQRTYTAWRKLRGLSTQDVRAITHEEARAIYRSQYWDAVRADELPVGLDLCVFDYAVNSGPAQAIKTLQRALGVTADGIVGEQTLAALSNVDQRRLIVDVCDRRLAFMQSLKNWRANKNGWSNRVRNIRAASVSAANGVVITTHPVDLVTPEIPKADPAQRKVSATAQGRVTGVAAMGTAATAAAQQLEPLLGVGPIIGYLVAAFTLLGVAAAFYSTREQD